MSAMVRPGSVDSHPDVARWSRPSATSRPPQAEERGYHNIGDPWKEQRHSYQEE
ncbi:hypothetical protein [Streptomyces sp. NPDC059742]|uniref:hypothetical protein n=1 Tax=Streptomyces sp. NPDC059742 TaxID=3346927 RepID=UPI00366676CB